VVVDAAFQFIGLNYFAAAVSKIEEFQRKICGKRMRVEMLL
jgi:hypothetical protein